MVYDKITGRNYGDRKLNCSSTELFGVCVFVGGNIDVQRSVPFLLGTSPVISVTSGGAGDDDVHKKTLPLIACRMSSSERCSVRFDAFYSF